MASHFRLPDWTARVVSPAIHVAARFTRPLTLGVRAVLFDADGKVLLVRHSYVPGWHFPGGAVEAGETLSQALEREIREEAGVVIEGEPRLHGIFFNRRVSRRDHVVVYVCRGAAQGPPRAPDWEIVATGFFDPEALPEGTTDSTRTRLAEILHNRPLDSLW